ncbi:MAG TPA: DUF1697 domain-containing protein [Candidatus Nitrosocosmicus sp.]|nr:DUF1697 domain-containing protein [Candidatus Nitrosocosmicus sp.]
MKYIAFLRGINVGGHSKVSMTELKKLLESLSFKHVKTLLNSGNIVFESDEMDKSKLKVMIEKHLEEKFGFKILIIVRSHEEIQKLVASNPFNGIDCNSETRFYVTFLAEISDTNLSIPYESSDKNFKIISANNTEVISLLTITKNKKTTDAMKILEKEFGKNVTTRNWNTVKKLSEL